MDINADLKAAFGHGYISDESSGTDLDRQLAVRLFGWKAGMRPFPSYSASREGMGLVLDAMADREIRFEITNENFGDRWRAHVHGRGGYVSSYQTGSDLVTAVCRAVVYALRRMRELECGGIDAS